MLSFMEWITFNSTNKPKVKKNVGKNSQGNQQNRTVDHKRETTRDDKTVYTTVVHDFKKSDWKDYNGSNQ